MADHYVFGRVERISPEAPIPVLRVEREEWRPGGVGSVVHMLCRLGAEVSIVAATGEDAEGRRLHRDLEGAGVSTEGLIVDPTRPTTVKTRMIANVQHLLRLDREVAGPYSSSVDRRLQEAALTRLENADAVVISDYGKGLLRGDLLAVVTARAKELGIDVLVDPKKTPDYSCYRGVTAITPNRAETSLGTGVKPKDPESWAEAGERLVKDLDLECAVVTLDRDGIYLHHKDGHHLHVPTKERAVYDVTGAGDMVISVIALCRAAGLGWHEATRLANVAAGIEITRVGVATLSRDEIREALLGTKDPSLRKILDLHAFTQGPLAELRRKQKRLVYTNGCFDILHVGHVKLLQRARELGDHLIVGLNSDASIRRLKGPGRPILDEHDRANLLASLEAVDHVLVFEDDTPLVQLEAILPDVLVKAEDYSKKAVVGRSLVEAAGGQVALIPLVGGVSTTQILERARDVHAADEAEQRAARASAEAAYAATEKASAAQQIEKREDSATEASRADA